ncbi:MAG: hypothetical protein PHX93_00830 [Candidatus Peribacteraceae bacterium]|nr:hypothetical protein [Candidatus Peribacteraceae bacterium]
MADGFDHRPSNPNWGFEEMYRRGMKKYQGETNELLRLTREEQERVGQRFERSRKLASELLEAVNARIHDLETRGAEKSGINYEEVMGYLKNAGGDLQNALNTLERERKQAVERGIARYGALPKFETFERQAQVIRQTAAEEEQIVENLDNLVMWYTQQTGKIEESFQRLATDSAQRTDKGVQIYRTFREQVYKDTEVRKAQREITEAEREVQDQQRGLSGKNLRKLKSEMDAAIQDEADANLEVTVAAELSQQATKALTDAKKQIEDAQKLRTEAADLERKAGEVEGQRKLKQDQLNEKKDKKAQEENAVDLQWDETDKKLKADLVQETARINAGAGDAAVKAPQIEAARAKAARMAAENNADAQAKKKKITDDIAALGAEIAAEKKPEDLRGAANVKKQEALDKEKAAGDVTVREGNEQARKESLTETQNALAKLKTIREQKEKAYRDTRKPLTDAEADLEKARTHLAEAKRFVRPTVEDERRSYEEVAEDTLTQIRQEGSLLYRNFDPDREVRWKLKGRDGKELQMTQAAKVRVRELCKAQTNILDDMIDRDAAPTVDRVDRVLGAIHREQTYLRGFADEEGVGERIGELLALDRKWKGKKAECLRRQAIEQAPILRAATDGAWAKVYETGGRRRSTATVGEIEAALDAVRAEGSSLFRAGPSALPPELKNRFDELKRAQSRLEQDERELRDALLKKELNAKLPALQAATNGLRSRADASGATPEHIARALGAVRKEGSLLHDAKKSGLLTPEQEQRITELLRWQTDLLAMQRENDRARVAAQETNGEDAKRVAQREEVVSQAEKFEEAINALRALHRLIAHGGSQKSLPSLREGLAALQERERRGELYIKDPGAEYKKFPSYKMLREIEEVVKKLESKK